MSYSQGKKSGKPRGVATNQGPSNRAGGRNSSEINAKISSRSQNMTEPEESSAAQYVALEELYAK